MKKLLISFILLLSVFITNAQNYRLNAGDPFPDIILRPVINAPMQAIDLNHYTSGKYFIINLWGTWCSPCIPEMEILAKMQNKYGEKIQVIGVSDDPVEKLKKFVLKKPSKIWLASDTASLLYRMIDLAYVGQSVIINPEKQVIALVKTDSINDAFIARLLAHKPIASNAQVKDKLDRSNADPFGVDSAMINSFTVRSYMPGQESLSRSPRYGKFAFRRLSFYNLGLIALYRNAYNIHSPKEMAYEIDKKKYDDYNDKTKLYCLDLLVAPDKKDSLSLILQKKLQESLPVKARTEMRTMEVYVLKKSTGTALSFSASKLDHLVYGFSGRGFDGQGVTLQDFAGLYLANELDLPVIDETGLNGRFDIRTTNDVRDKQNILNAVNKLGLTLEKAQRQVKVVVLYEK